MSNLARHEKMTLKAQTSVSVALMKYNKLRSKIKSILIVVEGYEDSVFYSSAFLRLNKNNYKFFFVAQGKDNVLGLRNLISLSKDIDRGEGVLFCVDRDFDGLKGFDYGLDIYITPTYSIENILVCPNGLERLLLTEFKLCEANLIDDIQKIKREFHRVIEEYKVAAEEANKIIFHARMKAMNGAVISASIDQKVSNIIDIGVYDRVVRKKCDGDQLKKSLGIKSDYYSENFDEYVSEFNKIDSFCGWRGKFIFYIYLKFLQSLIEDRNAAAPKLFGAGKGKISFPLQGESVIRSLTAVCDLPECLVEFAANSEPLKRE